MSNIHRVKYEGHKKYVSGAAAAEILDISGTAFSYLKHENKLDGISTKKFGASEYYNLQTVKEFKKIYKPRLRAKKLLPKTIKKINEAPDMPKVKTDISELVLAISKLQDVISKIDERVTHLYTLWE